MSHRFLRNPSRWMKIFCSSNRFQSPYPQNVVLQQRTLPQIVAPPTQRNSRRTEYGGGVLLSLSLFGFSSKGDDDGEETPENKIITVIKRAVLSMQREQFDKAEQMLHLALRMAQDLQSKDGITYVYDVMANLAMEREQYKKSEKLFTEVMRRLLEDGYNEDSIKFLHISLKMANIAQLVGDLNKSMTGFTWTIKKIQECLERAPDDVEAKELMGLAKYWFGQLLMKNDNYEEARECLLEAYECFTKIHGSLHEECITILNNLSVACVQLERFTEAISYLAEALKLAKETKDYQQQGVLQSNLGLVYIRQGLLDEAKKLCTQAWRLGRSKNDSATVDQAEYCLNEIKACTARPKLDKI